MLKDKWYSLLAFIKRIDRWWQQILVITFLMLVAIFLSAYYSEARANIPKRSIHFKPNFLVPSKAEQDRIKLLIHTLAPDISKELIRLASSESLFDQYAVGLSGEIGLFQIKPATAKSECGIDNKIFLFDLIPNILCATTYWRKINKRSLDGTFYAWNLGPNHKYNTKKLKCNDPIRSAKCHLNNFNKGKTK